MPQPERATIIFSSLPMKKASLQSLLSAMSAAAGADDNDVNGSHVTGRDVRSSEQDETIQRFSNRTTPEVKMPSGIVPVLRTSNSAPVLRTSNSVPETNGHDDVYVDPASKTDHQLPTATPDYSRCLSEVPLRLDGRLVPAWRRQFLARKRFEEETLQHEFIVKQEEEEARLSRIPRWKRELEQRKAYASFST